MICLNSTDHAKLIVEVDGDTNGDKADRGCDKALAEHRHYNVRITNPVIGLERSLG